MLTRDVDAADFTLDSFVETCAKCRRHHLSSSYEAAFQASMECCSGLPGRNTGWAREHTAAQKLILASDENGRLRAELAEANRTIGRLTIDIERLKRKRGPHG